MINKAETELLKIYVPKLVKRNLKKAATMAGCSVSSFAGWLLAGKDGREKELAILFLETEIARLREEAGNAAVKKLVAALAELRNKKKE